MAMFGAFSIIAAVALLASRATMVAPRPSSDVLLSLAPSSQYEYSPLAPSPALSPAEAAQNDYLESCAAELSEKCGQEIFSFVFENGKSSSKDCCKKLVSIGKECHAAMVTYSAGLPQFKANASEILRKSEQLWNKCSSAA